MWIETESGSFLNLDTVEVIFRDGEVVTARLASGGEITITGTAVEDAVTILRRHLVTEPSQIPTGAFRSP